MEQMLTRSALTKVRSDRSTEHQTVPRAWGGPKPEPFVNEQPWLWSQDMGLFQFSKGSVGLHSQLQGGLRIRSQSCFALWPTAAAHIRFIWHCHVQSNHMPVLKSVSTVYIQITKKQQHTVHMVHRGMITNTNNFLFRAHRIGENMIFLKMPTYTFNHYFQPYTL